MTGELGYLTCCGEYEAMKSIYSFCPHIPEPYGWGNYIEDDAQHSFLLAEFLNIKLQVLIRDPRIFDL
jgi:hypothetical protein